MRTKLICAIVVTPLLFVAITIVYNNIYRIEDATQLLRVAVKLSDLSYPIDPIRNPSLSNAFFVNNMYGNLISVSDSNEFEPELAESFRWEKNSLIISFSDSSIVNAADAEFNIKRSFLSDINDHGDLWKILCAAGESADECLQRIVVQGKNLILTAANSENLHMIIPVLASINYKIVPVAAFDSTDYKNAQIKNYEITSGKFHVKNDDFLRMFPNLNNFSKTDTVYSQVSIVDADSNNISSLIENKKIDVVSTTINFFEKDIQSLERNHWNLDKTHDIKITFLNFSEAAIRKTTVNERFLIARSIKVETKNSKAILSKNTEQYFQEFSQSYLSNEQLESVAQIQSAQLLENSVEFGAPVQERWQKALGHIKNLKVSKLNVNPLTAKEELKPDVFVLANDISFGVEYSQISHLIKSKIFKTLDKSENELISEYLSLKKDAQRVSFVNKLHYDVISKCYIFPIWSSPYVTAVGPGYASEMSKYNSRTLLWKIKKK